MGKKPRHSDEVFLRAWRQCESPTQVARRLNISHGEVRRRYLKLVAQGVEMPKQSVSP